MAVSSGYFDGVNAEVAPDRPHLADLIVQYLEKLGIEHVFGIPGGAIEPLYDALGRSARRGGPRPVVARHEGGAAFMADGYARETGKIGVVCSTTGPGATNLITGVASAFADNIPMLVITAQTALPNFGKRALQDSSCTAINTVGMFHHCTRYNTLISHPDQLENKLIAALLETQGPPRGPAHISIPMDVLRAPYRTSAALPSPQAMLRSHALVDARAMRELGNHLGQSQRIVLFLGSGASTAMRHIMELADLINATLVTTPSAKGLVNAFHPNYRGVFGFAGHESARRALHAEDVDLILAIGTSLDELETGGWDRGALLNHRLIHIDVTPEHFSRSPMARLHVCGELESIFETLTTQVREAVRWGRHWAREKLNNVTHLSSKRPTSKSVKKEKETELPPNLVINDAKKCYAETSPIKPQRVMLELARHCPATTRFHIDAGNAWSWATHYLHLRSANMQRIGMGFGAMAWAIGAAVGAAIGNPDAPSVCITGDGSYLMSGQELTVAVAEKLPVVFIVLNDGALGMVKHGQRIGGAEQIGYSIPPVNFALMAHAMGANGIRVTSTAQLAKIDFEALFAAEKPTLIDILIDGEEQPPMGARMKILKDV